jgi:GMP synthase-like glutamine amidotransferase
MEEMIRKGQTLFIVIAAMLLFAGVIHTKSETPNKLANIIKGKKKERIPIISKTVVLTDDLNAVDHNDGDIIIVTGGKKPLYYLSYHHEFHELSEEIITETEKFYNVKIKDWA